MTKSERKPFRRIGPAEARVLIATRAPAIFDVRDQRIFAAAHIDNARHLTIAAFDAETATLSANRPILIYCYHGIASQEWAQLFSDLRYQEVYSLDGGYEAWHQAAARAPALRAGAHPEAPPAR